MAVGVKKNSFLRQLYLDQKPSDTEQPKKIEDEFNGKRCLFGCIFVGALVNSSILIPIIVLYVRQKNNSITPSSTVATTDTTTPFSYSWNTTGIVVAGITGSPGTTSNQLQNPYGLALDSANSLYIVDRINNRVQKYLAGASSGTTVAGQTNGLGGSAATQLNQPGYIVLDSNSNMYVTDSANHRVQFWRNGGLFGTTVAGTGINGSALNQFNTPRGIARDPNTGTLYVADQYNHRIMSYTSGAALGAIIAGGNGCGSSLTQLCQPVGVQFDSSSNSLYISNYQTHTIVRWVLGASSSTIIAGTYNAPGGSSTLLDSPTGLILDSRGNVYVADTNNHRIILFMSGQTNGTTIVGTSGVPGSSLSLLNMPFWVSLDSQANLYVSDRSNHRVLKFPHY